MNNHPQRPPIPSQLPIDKRNNEAGNICRYLNTAIKRAQRQGPIDEMRLDLNQAARAIERFENQHNDTDLVDRWKEVLKQLESCYHYFTQASPNKTVKNVTILLGLKVGQIVGLVVMITVLCKYKRSTVTGYLKIKSIRTGLNIQ